MDFLERRFKQGIPTIVLTLARVITSIGGTIRTTDVDQMEDTFFLKLLYDLLKNVGTGGVSLTAHVHIVKGLFTKIAFYQFLK